MQMRDLKLGISLFFACLLTIVGAIGTMAGLSTNTPRLLWGFTANANLLASTLCLYYLRGQKLKSHATIPLGMHAFGHCRSLLQPHMLAPARLQRVCCCWSLPHDSHL